MDGLENCFESGFLPDEHRESWRILKSEHLSQSVRECSDEIWRNIRVGDMECFNLLNMFKYEFFECFRRKHHMVMESG